MGVTEWTKPENWSHELFTTSHIIFICIMVVILVGACFFFKYKKVNEDILYIVLSVITLSTTLIILIYSIINNSYNLEWFLPFHICNVFQFIFLFSSIFKNKVRNFLKEYIFYFGVIGCLVGNTVPSSSLYYFDMLELVPICLFVYHLCLGISGLYLWLSGTHVVRLFNVWKALVVLIPVIIGAICCNLLWDTDFLALNMIKPIPGFALFMNLFGDFYPYFLVGGVITLMLAVMFAGFIIELIKSKLIKEITNSEGFKTLLKTAGVDSIKTSIVTLINNSPKCSGLIAEYKDRFLQSDFYKEIVEKGVLEKLKNITIEQLCTPAYWFSICKEANVLRHLLSFVRIWNFRKEIRYIKSYSVA